MAHPPIPLACAPYVTTCHVSLLTTGWALDRRFASFTSSVSLSLSLTSCTKHHVTVTNIQLYFASWGPGP